MSRIPTSFFDVPSLFAGNLIQGDLGAAGRSLVAPDTLAPGEMKGPADAFGLVDPKDDSLWAKVLRTATNPIVLTGLVMTIRYPIPLAREMFASSEVMARIIKRVGPVMRNIGSLQQIFSDTEIPTIYKQIEREVLGYQKEYGDRLAHVIVKAQDGGLKWNRRTQLLVSSTLDGLDSQAFQKGGPLLEKIQEGSVFNTLVKDIRVIQDDIWDKIFSNNFNLQVSRSAAWNKLSLPKRTGFLKEFPEMSVKAGATGVRDERAASALSAAVRRRNDSLRRQYFEIPKKANAYFPRQMSRSLDDFEETVRKMMTEAKGMSEKEWNALGYEAASRQASGSVLGRIGGMAPDPEDLKLISEYLKPDSLKRVNDYLSTLDSEGTPRRAYSLQFMKVMSSWFHGLAKTHAWNLATDAKGAPLGPKLMLEVEKLASKDQVRANMMRDSYIPLALGRQTHRQALSNLKWQDMKFSMWNTLQEPWAKKLIPDDLRGWLGKRLQESGGPLGRNALSGRLAGHLYLGALGGNPVSAAYNTLQTVLTTAPTIGPKATWEGIQGVMTKAPKYFRGRGAGLSHEQALSKAFPTFHEAGMVANPIVDEAIGHTLRHSWDMAGPITPLGKATDKVRGAMMAMFQTSENAVRLVAFEGAMGKATKEGLSRVDALGFARRVVEETQYLGGVSNLPSMMKEWNPLLRQFMQFPTRTAGFALETATRIGTGAASGPYANRASTGALGRNWGTLGRMGLYSALTYEGGKEFLGADLSQGLLWGALPVPHPDAPFSPLPLVPPAISLVGGAVQDVLKGELDNIRYSAPLLVPGGLAAARASTMMGQKTAQTLGRDYIDYDGQLPDGRYPKYTKEGSFIGYFSPWQVYMDSLGFPMAHRMGKDEKDIMGFLMGQRDRIRGDKKNYIEALVRNDIDQANTLQEEFRKDFPMLPGFQLTDQDIRALEARTTIPRLERLLDTLPPDVRPHYGELVSNLLAQEAEKLVGVDPLLLSEVPTSRQRNPWREQRPDNYLGLLSDRRAYGTTIH